MGSQWCRNTLYIHMACNRHRDTLFIHMGYNTYRDSSAASNHFIHTTYITTFLTLTRLYR